MIERCQKTNANDVSLVRVNQLLIDAYLKYEYYDKTQRHIDYVRQLKIIHEAIKAFIDREILFSQLSLYNRNHQLQKIKTYIDSNVNTLTVSTQLPRPFASTNQFKIEYLISLLFLKKHTEALRWILECDNDKTFRTDDINYQLVMLIQVVLHYVMNDSETAQREAKKHDKNKKHVFAPVFKALAVADKTKREKEFTEAINSNTKTQTFLLLEYFDVFDWTANVLNKHN